MELRERVDANRRRIEQLRRELEELRALASAPVHQDPPFMKEASAVSASAAAPFRTGGSYDSWKPVPYIAIFFLTAGFYLQPMRRPAPAVEPSVAAASPVAADDGADEALLLAHEWKVPGDQRPLSELLGTDTNPPGTQPEWTAERTGERTYRVSYRANRAEFGYDFDVDLAVRRVDPTAETTELLSPRLVSRR